MAEFNETGWVTSARRGEVGDRLKEGSGRGGGRWNGAERE